MADDRGARLRTRSHTVPTRSYTVPAYIGTLLQGRLVDRCVRARELAHHETGSTVEANQHADVHFVAGLLFSDGGDAVHGLRKHDH